MRLISEISEKGKQGLGRGGGKWGQGVNWDRGQTAPVAEQAAKL